MYGAEGTPAADPLASSDVPTRPSRLFTGSTNQYFGCAWLLKQDSETTVLTPFSRLTAPQKPGRITYFNLSPAKGGK
jgi:hypothetical protein